MQSGRHKIKCLYTPDVCQSIIAKKQPSQYRGKCRQFQNPNNSRTLCEISRKSASKIRKSENENFKSIVQNAQKNILC